jgi:hypothetical protein
VRNELLSDEGRRCLTAPEPASGASQSKQVRAST